MLSDFYKEEPWHTIWCVSEMDEIGKLLFSFDKKKIYNLWQDYPHNFTPEEKATFDKEFPYWADFFKDRPYNPNNDETA